MYQLLNMASSGDNSRVAKKIFVRRPQLVVKRRAGQIESKLLIISSYTLAIAILVLLGITTNEYKALHHMTFLDFVILNPFFFFFIFLFTHHPTLLFWTSAFSLIILFRSISESPIPPLKDTSNSSAFYRIMGREMIGVFLRGGVVWVQDKGQIGQLVVLYCQTALKSYIIRSTHPVNGLLSIDEENVTRSDSKLGFGCGEHM
ncbi:hypothetical protein V2J09_009722 [Rumex salicifolius]